MATASLDSAAVSVSEAANGRDAALIAALCLVLYLAGNDRVSLWDRDEAWYAETAREMLHSGDFVVPRFNAEPRYRKPVLIYWLMAAAYSVFGDSEFGARFCSGVAGAITCLLTYRLGTRMHGRRVGLAAALMLAVAPFMIVESKLATTDAVLTAILVGAFSCLWELHAAGPSWRWSLAFWLLLGTSILTKGPFGPAFVALATGVWLVLSRQSSVLRRLRWLPGQALMLAVCLPWGVAIYVATNGDFYRVAIAEQALGHSLGSMNDHFGFPGFYVLVTFAGLFPWTLCLIPAFAGVRRWARENGPNCFLLGWMIGPLLMVEFMRTKLPQYYLPAFPAWAILIARGVVEAHAAGSRLIQTKLGLVRVAVLGLIWIGGAAALAALALTIAPADTRPPLVALAGVLFVAAATTLVCFLTRRDRAAWISMVAASWSFGLMTAAWLLPSAENCRIARVSAEALRAEADAGSLVALFGFREPSLVFYFQQPVPSFSSPKELAKFIRTAGPVCTLLRDSDLAKLKRVPEIIVEPAHRFHSQSLEGLRRPSVQLARLRIVIAPDGPANEARREPAVQR